MSWVDAELQDLVVLQRGFDITKAQQRPGDVPVISSSGAQSFHNEAKVKGPGVIVGRKGSVGTVYFTKTDYWPHDTTLWSKDLKGNDPKFIFYFLQTLQLSRFDTGNSNPTLNRNHIHKLPIKKPELDEQQRIASVLSAYDDLIENNRRRIALLEEAARLLYREWFVHFRFPGQEHVKIVDGVPENWTRKPFSDLGEFLNGFAFKPHHLGEHGLPIVKIPELKGGILEKTPRYDGHEVPEKYLLVSGDLIFSWSGTLAVDFWVNGNAYLNQHLFKVTPVSNVSAAFLLIAIREAMPRFLNQSVGATMKHIRRSALSDVDVLLPPDHILDDFQGTVDSNYGQVRVLKQQNMKLAEARDLLLPRLMDGRLEV